MSKLSWFSFVLYPPVCCFEGRDKAGAIETQRLITEALTEMGIPADEIAVGGCEFWRKRLQTYVPAPVPISTINYLLPRNEQSLLEPTLPAKNLCLLCSTLSILIGTGLHIY